MKIYIRNVEIKLSKTRPYVYQFQLISLKGIVMFNLIYLFFVQLNVSD